MTQKFASLIKGCTEAITKQWIDGIYAERRTQLPSLLSYGQLVNHLPDILDELGCLLGNAATGEEIAEAARGLRAFPQVRFQQKILLDEVARELMILRQVISAFLWREVGIASGEDVQDLHNALERANRFIDEMITQSVIVYAASQRPPVSTRASIWPPPRRAAITKFPGSSKQQ